MVNCEFFTRSFYKLISVVCLGYCAAIPVTAITAVANTAAANTNKPTPELHRLGKKLYADNCAICHGPNGDGMGSLGVEFTPRPRNFTKGAFKLRSTGLRQEPSRADINRVITNGIEGSYGRTMPAFEDFITSERQALAEVVRQFADIREYGTPYDVPPMPEWAGIEHAMGLYKKSGCATCHGASGDGKGPKSAELKDQNGMPLMPADFTDGALKGGTELEEIWLRIFNGLDGTPMPAFGNQMSPEDIWSLARLIREMGTK